MSQLSSPTPAAVVVPESVEKCRDVLSASPNLVRHTPCPFSLAIYTWRDSGTCEKTVYPLIYVSEQVACDRDPDTNETNRPGVRPGWYLIADPGRFKVHVAVVNREPYGLPWENGILINLDVDGKNTNQEMIYLQEGDDCDTNGITEYTFDGFVEKQNICEASHVGSSFKGWEKVRPFAFQKVNNSEISEDGPSDDVGTIKLKVSAGAVRKVYGIGAQVNEFRHSQIQVTWRGVSKEGRSMRMSNHPSLEPTKRVYKAFNVEDHRRLPEADITIYVRERSWMKSRRLIDDNDQPLTYGIFRRIIRQKEGKHAHEDSGSYREERPAKRMKIKEETVGNDIVEPVKPGEVIDLT